MSDVIPFKGQKVAKAFAHLDPNKALGEGVTGGGFPIINFRGKIWSLSHQGQKHFFTRADDGTQLSYLDVIIVGHPPYIAKTYYPDNGEGFDEDNKDPPVCTSLRGDRPDPGVPEPQSPTCPSCKHYGWTTLPNGRKGKECQDQKRLAVLLMPAMTKRMLGAPLLEPVYLKVPPGSLTALKAFGDELRHEGFPFCAVVTRIGFKPDKLFQMTFDVVKVLSDAEAPLVLPMLEDPRTLRITGEDDQPREIAAKPAVKRVERIETGLEEAFAKPTKVDEKVETIVEVGDGAEPEPAPAKRRGRPAKAKAEPAQLDIEDVAAAKPAGVTWDEGDTELDQEVAALLNKKVENMLK